MSAADDVDALIERYQLALGDFMKGDPEPVKGLSTKEKTLSWPTPSVPRRMDGMRSVPPSSVLLRTSGMVG